MRILVLLVDLHFPDSAEFNQLDFDYTVQLVVDDFKEFASTLVTLQLVDKVLEGFKLVYLVEGRLQGLEVDLEIHQVEVQFVFVHFVLLSVELVVAIWVVSPPPSVSAVHSVDFSQHFHDFGNDLTEIPT